jgi:hypothetical protein
MKSFIMQFYLACYSLLRLIPTSNFYRNCTEKYRVSFSLLTLSRQLSRAVPKVAGFICYTAAALGDTIKRTQIFKPYKIQNF